MNLIFQRGDRSSPTGHALIYWQAADGTVLATYIGVPPIPFDLSKYMPGFLSQAMQGMAFGNETVATPIPPIPEQVESVEWLRRIADHRQDDLVFAGGTMTGDPMRLASDAAEAARQYGELYAATAPESVPDAPQAADPELESLGGMSELEQLNELSSLTGRMRDALRFGAPDPDTESRMRALSSLLPAKYRAHEMVAAALTPGERGQRLAQLYLERSYKLYNEEYLDLERIDREIGALEES